MLILLIPFILFFSSFFINFLVDVFFDAKNGGLKAHLGFSFVILFTTYSLLTLWTGMKHSSGIYNVIVIIFVFLIPFVAGLSLFILIDFKKNLKKYWFFLCSVTMITFILLINSTKIDVYRDYRIYIPMMNSVSGKVYNGVDNFALYSHLSLYHFFGAIKIITFTKSVPFFINAVVPIIFASVISLFVVELKRYKIPTLMAISSIVILGYWNNYVSYGSIVWAYIFIGSGILAFNKKQYLIFGLSMLCSTLSSGSSNISVIIIVSALILLYSIRNKKISLKILCMLAMPLVASLLNSMILAVTEINSMLLPVVFILSLVTILFLSLEERDVVIENKVFSYNKNSKLAFFSSIKFKFVVLVFSYALLVISLIFFGDKWTVTNAGSLLLRGSNKIKGVELYIPLAFMLLFSISLLFTTKGTKFLFMNILTWILMAAFLTINNFVQIIEPFVITRTLRILIGVNSFMFPIIISSEARGKNHKFELIASLISIVVLLLSLSYFAYFEWDHLISGFDLSSWRNSDLTQRVFLNGGSYDEEWLKRFPF